MKTLIRRLLPKTILEPALEAYHLAWALLGAVIYHFPSRSLSVVGITGTKGKTSTAEMVNAILEEAGHTTALAGTLRFKVGATSRRNLFKMSMPGRFFLQKFLREAADAGCDWVVLEMTSEGAKQHRHRGIELDALIFTNLAPEHIESHGSFENYKNAKLRLADSLSVSTKPRHVIIANAEDAHAEAFINHAGSGAEAISYSLADAAPYEARPDGVSFTWKGTRISSPLRGEFNIKNMLAAASFADAFGIRPEIVAHALATLSLIRGRAESVKLPADEPLREKQDFEVIVDYAHTIDSLRALYEAFPTERKICVLGNTGGGRDTWKRKGMAEVADEHCSHVILTNEDPYDEDPRAIVDAMKEGLVKHEPEIIMDRRQAINRAISLAGSGDAVLITGKGTDPYIMGPNGTKQEWDDATVAREELAAVLARK
jgi:UDP-N-acetylmuramoyl-L-alanyl-D-glutamate--2,6-diaminopimelate ligase